MTDLRDRLQTSVRRHLTTQPVAQDRDRELAELADALSSPHVALHTSRALPTHRTICADRWPLAVIAVQCPSFLGLVLALDQYEEHPFTLRDGHRQ